MAVDLLTNLSAALAQLFSPELSRQWNRATVIARELPVKIAGGKNLGWDVEFGGAAAASYVEGADVTSGELLVDPVVPAIIPWACYRSSFGLSGMQLAAATSSMGNASALTDIVGERLMNSASKVASVINSDLYVGTGSSNTIVGLLGGALEATSSYAGIYRTGGSSNYTEWMGNILANGGTSRALTLDLLYQLEANIFIASNMQPDLIICDPQTYRKYAGLFETLRRINGDGNVPMGFGSGASELFFKGIPVIRDKDMPSGHLMMLNRNELEINVLSTVSAGDAVREGSIALPGTVAPLHIDSLAKTGDSIKFSVKSYLQLKVKRPNACGYIADISVS